MPAPDAATAFDVLIVGGGPAGLSAALVLGRARRRVLVVDDGHPRNAASKALHGLLSRDGTAPLDLLRMGRAELERYENVTLHSDRVERVQRHARGFEAETRSGQRIRARKLILATGMVDALPPLDGVERWYGRGIYHCPYCDGWEHRDQALVAYGYDDARGGMLALELLCWSTQVVLCVDGRKGLSADCHARLLRHGVRLREERILRLEGDDDGLQRIVFEHGPPEPCAALFFYSERQQGADLAEQLGSDQCEGDACSTHRFGRTDISGVYIIGDASRDVQQVAVAIGEGSQAAIALNAELVAEDYP